MSDRPTRHLPVLSAFDSRKRPVLLATGGTGGHFYPALSLARRLLELNYRVEIVTDSRGQAFERELPGVPVHMVTAASPSVGGLRGRLKAIGTLLAGTRQAVKLMHELNPGVVVGFGGYAATPGVAAAALQRRRLVLHEQNAVAGRVNRLFAPAAAAIATGFPKVARLGRSAARAVHTGNPVRSAFLDARAAGYPAISAKGPVRLMVLGGSQGARILADVVPRALARLPGPLRTRLSVTMQARPEDLDGVQNALRAAGVWADCSSFFSDVPERLRHTHLLVCRSGASTVAELATVGRPALYIPYPHATDDHQTGNARAMVEAGGGWLVPQPGFTDAALAAQIEDLFAHPMKLADAAQAARLWGTVDATDRLAQLVTGLDVLPAHLPEVEADPAVPDAILAAVPNLPAEPEPMPMPPPGMPDPLPPAGPGPDLPEPDIREPGTDVPPPAEPPVPGFPIAPVEEPLPLDEPADPDERDLPPAPDVEPDPDAPLPQELEKTRQGGLPPLTATRVTEGAL